MPSNEFYISPHNPNAEQGGGDLCYPNKQTVDVRGPWVVFPNVDVAQAQGDTPLPHASLPLSIVKQILVEASGVPADDTGGEGDVRDKIKEPAAETLDWTEIPADVQLALQTQFPKGGRTRTSYGVTTVPPRLLPPEADVTSHQQHDSVVDIDLPREPRPTAEELLTPDAKGGLSPVLDPEDEEGLDI